MPPPPFKNLYQWFLSRCSQDRARSETPPLLLTPLSPFLWPRSSERERTLEINVFSPLLEQPRRMRHRKTYYPSVAQLMTSTLEGKALALVSVLCSARPFSAGLSVFSLAEKIRKATVYKGRGFWMSTDCPHRIRTLAKAAPWNHPPLLILPERI